MAKTNYTKAEEAWSESLQKMTKSKLLEEADTAQGRPSQAEMKARSILAAALKRELKRLHRLDKDIYKKLGIKKKSLDQQLEDLAALTQEEWKGIVQTKEKVEQYHQQLAKAVTDDKLVEEQRHLHINKRFNVSEKWLPLK
jgi:hypothetical protein